MKKLLSVLMIFALLLVPAFSVAEVGEELGAVYLEYTHTDNQYTFMYPGNWILLNQETIQTIGDMPEGEIYERLADSIDTYGPQMEQFDAVILLSESGLTTVTVIAQYLGMRVDDKQLLAVAPVLVAQLANEMPDVEFTNEGTLIELNGMNGLLLEYTQKQDDTTLQLVQVCVAGADTLYTFAYGCSDADEAAVTTEDFYFILNTLELE